MKKSRLFLIATLALATAFTIVACSDDDNKEKKTEETTPTPDETEPGIQTDDYYYELLSSEATIGCEGGVVEFQVHTDLKYAVNVISGSEWLYVESEGTEDEAAEETYTVVLVVGESTLEEERFGEVVVTFYHEAEEVGTASFTVTQEAYEALYATVEADNTTLYYDANTEGLAAINITVETNCGEPVVELSDDWLFVNSSSDTKVVIGAYGYDFKSDVPRTATITLTFAVSDDENIEYTIEVTQYGRDYTTMSDMLGEWYYEMSMNGVVIMTMSQLISTTGEVGIDEDGKSYTKLQTLVNPDGTHDYSEITPSYMYYYEADASDEDQRPYYIEEGNTLKNRIEFTFDENGEVIGMTPYQGSTGITWTKYDADEEEATNDGGDDSSDSSSTGGTSMTPMG